MGQPRFRFTMDASDLPNDEPRPLPPGAYLLYPVAFSAAAGGPAFPWPQLLYQVALQQAQAVHEPSLLQRQLAPCRN